MFKKKKNLTREFTFFTPRNPNIPPPLFHNYHVLFSSTALPQQQPLPLPPQHSAASSSLPSQPPPPLQYPSCLIFSLPQPRISFPPQPHLSSNHQRTIYLYPPSPNH
ncbi:hypothetical protein ACH5RR_034194 [Cinchona calisaya]|uniref:Uncharacterized protein n=1 Tax=Cinchona calisaya TaxID=153742 RepID=A0ABD2YBJ3_9GENT